MRLSEVPEQHVVQNISSRAFYRMERCEADRVRIRPLEPFWNGRIIEKTTDTIVEADIEVTLVAPWSPDMIVDVTGAQVKRPDTLRRELAKLEGKLSELESADIPPKGRGSHANKVKNVRHRITVLLAGLEPPVANSANAPVMAAVELPKYSQGQAVLLSSGRIARFLEFVSVSATGVKHAAVQTSIGRMVAPPDSLSPLIDRYCATV
jgi:hypothetical protein